MGEGNSEKTGRRRFDAWAGLVIFLIAVVLVLYAIDVIGNLPAQNITNLSSVEVREYQGEQLSSVRDFRENSIHGPQYIEESAYTLVVTGLVEDSQDYTYDEVLASFPHYRKVVTLYCVEGWDVTILWDGVMIADLLDEAGVDPRANTVIFHAKDGYTSSLPLDYIRERNILLAYRMNNLTLPAERGFPFQVVAEERWGYKWVKWVTEIEVSSDPQYRGYWERRGYANNGSLSLPFLEGRYP
jgi:DMSO/TMAO reductase YedYZ molybdopterin-dependent catalytic subunit